MRDVVIVGGVRTPIGSFGGTLKDVPAVELGGIVIREVLRRARVSPEKVDLVVMGNVLQAGLGQNPARQAAIKGGIPQYVAAVTVNVVCGSGMEAVITAAQKIKAGDAEVVVAGGMENMSQAPYVMPQSRWGQRMGHGQVFDVMIRDGLWCAFSDTHMGITAENVAQKFSISRADQDRYAAASQAKAERAIAAGRFAEEIVPVPVPQRRGDPVPFDTDEFPRAGTTPESLAKLKPAFDKKGTVTAGNSSGVNDGAAALLVMSAEKAYTLGLEPMARIVAYDSRGCEPELMGIGPIFAVQSAIAKVQSELGGRPLDLVELNEAFAAQAIACQTALQIDQEKVNVNGGAIALGHPIGCSGARVLVTLMHEMRRRDVAVGLGALCVGGGMGFAMIIEREREAARGLHRRAAGGDGRGRRAMDRLTERLTGRYPKQVRLEDGSTVTFRPLRKADEGALAAFLGSLPLRDRACLKEDVADPKVITRWIDHLDYDNVLPVVALDDGRIVGDTTLHFNPTGWSRHQGEIRLTTDAAYRARGLGRLLTQEVIDIARELGLEQLSIELAPELHEAYQLCVKLGFKQVAVLEGFITDLEGAERDLLLMVKRLRD
jgi:acetyl-CoA C-acetyltransferase